MSKLGGWLMANNDWRDTVALMSTLRDEWKKSVEVRELVAGIVRPLPQDDTAAVADAVYKYIRERVRYTPDINGVETIQAPLVTLQLGIGDCDDMALLAATLLEAAGCNTSWWLLGYASADVPEHIAVYVPIDWSAICIDCTIDTAMSNPLADALFSQVR